MPPRNCLLPGGRYGIVEGISPLVLPSAGLEAVWGKVYSGGDEDYFRQWQVAPPSE
jgi:hypothetical protein